MKVNKYLNGEQFLVPVNGKNESHPRAAAPNEEKYVAAIPAASVPKLSRET
jgi:hypothetical protein